MNDHEYEQFLRACMAECPDLVSASVAARNCLLYEADPGPADLQATFLSASPLVPRCQAWQLSYAMGLLDECGGDAARVRAARTACTSLCVRCPCRDGRRGRVELSRRPTCATRRCG